MYTRMQRMAVLTVILPIALLLAACGGRAKPAAQAVPTVASAAAPSAAPAAAPAAAPSATALPATATATAVPTATSAPSPTPAPAVLPSPTFAPTEGPQAAMPDARSDPQSALLYSASAKGMRSANFTYDMNMAMAPADDASTKALGPAAAILSNLAVKASGSGALQVVDAAKGVANLSMEINAEAMGQTLLIQTVTVSGTTWTRVGTGSAWQKADAATETATAKTEPFVDPGNMLLAFAGATDVRWLDDNPVNDQPVHHLSFRIDPAKLNLAGVLDNSQNGQATPEEVQAIMQQMTIDAEAWLGAGDLLPRQEKMTIGWVMQLPGAMGVKAQLKVDLDVLMVFDKINQPVEIVAPIE